MFFCPKCGTGTAAGVRFCTNCGTPLAAIESKAPEISVVPIYQRHIVPEYQQPLQMTPYYQGQPMQQQINIHVPSPQTPLKNKWETPRLIVGIFTIVLCFLLQF